MDLKSQSMGQRKNRITLCFLLMLLVVTGCSKQETMETVKIENSTYTKSQIYEHVKLLFPSLATGKEFTLWEAKKEPYYCATNLKDSIALAILNKAMKAASALTPLNIEECFYWFDAEHGEKPASMIIAYEDDFTKINEKKYIKQILKRSLSLSEINELNEGYGVIHIQGYYPENSIIEYVGITFILQKNIPAGGMLAKDLLILSLRQVYSTLLASPGESSIIKESISHPNNKRLDFSTIDKYILQFSYELSGKGLSLSDVHDQLTNRLFDALGDK